MIATNVDNLHSDKVNVTKQTALTEKGEVVSGRGDPVNTHDILTGSDPQGNYSTAGGDTTCGNWTKSGDGSAIVGHHDRAGLKDTRHMNSWNSSHGSRGCSQDQLKASGGAGMIYTSDQRARQPFRSMTSHPWLAEDGAKQRTRRMSCAQSRPIV